VHDGVEVQVEDRFAGCGEPGFHHRGVQGGQEGALLLVRASV
jgi:hypothetical protein